MAAWQIVLWVMAAIGGAAAMYALHRLALRLEERGLIYYLREKPGSAAGSFVELQRALEPRVQHVLYVDEQKRHHSEEEAPGDGDRPASEAPEPDA